MDLRVKKTRRSITKAFLELRAKKPIEKISVKELTEAAEINKATFYLHYKDIYDLSEELEKEIIESIFSKIEHPDLIVTEPKLFIKELSEAFHAERDRIDIVFSTEREGLMIGTIEKKIKELVYEKQPEYKGDMTANVVLTFLIKGGYYAFSENMGSDNEKLLKIVGDVTERIAGDPKFLKRKE